MDNALSPLTLTICLLLALAHLSLSHVVPSAREQMENDMSHLANDYDFSPNSCPSTPFNRSDYLLLVQSNQVTFCGSKGSSCDSNLVSKLFDQSIFFTIHGMWPQLENKIEHHAWPQCCASDSFDERGLGDLQDTMAHHSWVKVTSFTLWEHEWSKHGTCALYAQPDIPYINSQYDYFKYANQLYFDMNINEMLLDAGIYPNDNKPVAVSDLYQAFESRFNARPIISYYNKNHQKLIQEVWMCVSKSSPQFIPCPSSLHTGHEAHEGDMLIFPTKSHLH